MKFENALVALRKGYKVCRKTSINRLNGVYYKMDKEGHIRSYSTQTSKETFFAVWNTYSVEATDWQVYDEVKHDKD